MLVRCSPLLLALLVGCQQSAADAPAVIVELRVFDGGSGRESWSRLERSGTAYIFERHDYGLEYSPASMNVHARFVRDGKVVDCWNSRKKPLCEDFPFDSQPLGVQDDLDKKLATAWLGSKARRRCDASERQVVEEEIQPLLWRSSGTYASRVWKVDRCPDSGDPSLGVPINETTFRGTVSDLQMTPDEMQQKWHALKVLFESARPDDASELRRVWLRLPKPNGDQESSKD